MFSDCCELRRSKPFKNLVADPKRPQERVVVVSHEIGHHVQNFLGISEQVQAQRARFSEAEYNQLSVRLELQADYLSGVWAHHAQRNWP